jgi:hypothetical protein
MRHVRVVIGIDIRGVRLLVLAGSRKKCERERYGNN